MSLDDGTYEFTAVATDVAGNASVPSAEFLVMVDTRPPTVTVGSASTTVNEGDTAVNTGVFADSGVGTVSLSVSVGTILDNGDGTWSWSFVTSDGPAESQTVVIAATDSLGASSEISFTLVVNNVGPVVEAGTNVTIHEGQSVSRSGFFTDPGADTWTAMVDYGLGDGPIALTLNSDKTFDLNCTYTIPGVYTVKVTIADDEGAADTTTFEVAVNGGPGGERRPGSMGNCNVHSVPEWQRVERRGRRRPDVQLVADPPPGGKHGDALQPRHGEPDVRGGPARYVRGPAHRQRWHGQQCTGHGDDYHSEFGPGGERRPGSVSACDIHGFPERQRVR